jgi:RNA polymerase-binding transcription factor DksA
MRLICDFCGKPFSKARNQIRKHNFCCKECYFKFKREHPRYGIDKRGYNTGRELNTLKEWAKIYAKT